MAFDVEDRMELINQPLLMIAVEKADTLYMTKDAFAKATGTENKELFLIPGASHIRTYWVLSTWIRWCRSSRCSTQRIFDGMR